MPDSSHHSANIFAYQVQQMVQLALNEQKATERELNLCGSEERRMPLLSLNKRGGGD